MYITLLLISILLSLTFTQSLTEPLATSNLLYNNNDLFYNNTNLSNGGVIVSTANGVGGLASTIQALSNLGIGSNSGGLNIGLNSLSGLPINIASLGAVGTGVGLNTTGLEEIKTLPLNEMTVLNTSSLTGNVFTQTIKPGITIKTQVVETAPIQTQINTAPVITGTTIVSDIPNAVGLKVKDSNGNIIHVNGFDSSRTTQYLNPALNLKLFNLYKSESNRNILHEGQILQQGQYIVSSNKAYYLILQKNGNLVIYCSNVLIPRNVIWSSNTADKGVSGERKLTLTNTANIIIFQKDLNNRIWQSNTNSNNGPHKLVMQDDGNLVLYSAKNEIIWESHTTRK